MTTANFAHNAIAKPGEYLSFCLSSEEYAINILTVQEIRGFEKPTKIANTPAHLLGVINLRGAIVPIVDLRIQFGNDKPEYTEFTVVIILNVGKKVVGIVVDSVSDVVLVKTEDIKPPPEFSASLKAEYLSGLCKFEDRLLILVEIDRLILGKDLALFNDLEESAVSESA